MLLASHSPDLFGGLIPAPNLMPPVSLSHGWRNGGMIPRGHLKWHRSARSCAHNAPPRFRDYMIGTGYSSAGSRDTFYHIAVR